MSPTGRNVLILLAAVALSFVLVIAGRLISYSLCFRGNPSGAGYKSALITFFLVQSLVVFPISAIITGISVGLLAQRGAWLLAGAGVLPLLIYDLTVNSWQRPEVFLSIIDLALSMTAAFGISWLKNFRRRVPASGHV